MNLRGLQAVLQLSTIRIHVHYQNNKVTAPQIKQLAFSGELNFKKRLDIKKWLQIVNGNYLKYRQLIRRLNVALLHWNISFLCLLSDDSITEDIMF